MNAKDFISTNGIEDTIRASYEKVMGSDLDDAEWGLTLEGDLDMNGLDFVEFIMDLEARFQISIHDDDAEKIFTPRDCFLYLQSVLSPVKKPHGFCVKPDSDCTMNYCDDNGCNERKREPVESQEEIFDELFSIYFARLHDGLSMYDAVKEMETRYILTRKESVKNK